MLRELLSDGEHLSMMRLLSLIIVIAAILIAIIGMIIGVDLAALSILCGVFLSTALGAKIGQAVVEARNE